VPGALWQEVRAVRSGRARFPGRGSRDGARSCENRRRCLRLEADSAQTGRADIGRLPGHLERIERAIEAECLHFPCRCGEIVTIGEDRIERLDVVPTWCRGIVTISPQYAGRPCVQGVKQAAAPAYLIEGALPTKALIVQVSVSKYSAISCFIVRSKSMPGPASSWIVRPWRDGAGQLRIASRRWSPEFLKASRPQATCAWMKPNARCWIPDA